MSEDIIIRRTFAASPQQVFDAWTDPAQFAVWFGTKGTLVTDVVMDVRVGGEWAAMMIIGTDSTIAWSGTFVELDPPLRLVLTLQDRPGPEHEVCTVELSAVDDGTQMLFTQVGGHMDEAGYARAKEGWEAFFSDLAALLPA